MATYNVIWEEKHSVNVEAKSENEAIDKIHRSDYDQGETSAEVSVPPKAYKMD